MKIIKRIVPVVIIVLGFLNCSSSRELQHSIPLKIGESYYQYDKTDLSVINLYIPITSNSNNIKLDSVYFREQQSKLELIENNLFVAHFKIATSLKKDIIMSSDPYAEYGNTVPKLTKKARFKLQENECIISFKDKSKTKYFKIEGLTKK